MRLHPNNCSKFNNLKTQPKYVELNLNVLLRFINFISHWFIELVYVYEIHTSQRDLQTGFSISSIRIHLAWDSVRLLCQRYHRIPESSSRFLHSVTRRDRSREESNRELFMSLSVTVKSDNRTDWTMKRRVEFSCSDKCFQLHSVSTNCADEDKW